MWLFALLLGELSGSGVGLRAASPENVFLFGVYVFVAIGLLGFNLSDGVLNL